MSVMVCVENWVGKLWLFCVVNATRCCKCFSCELVVDSGCLVCPFPACFVALHLTTNREP